LTSLEHELETTQARRSGDRFGGWPRARLWFGRALSEPLFHFFIIGLILFVAGAQYKRATSEYRIEVTPERVDHLALAYRLQFGATPSPSALEAMIDRWVDEEVLYREGLALKLDRDDEIVRRRIVQKMQFLQQDLQAPAEPTDAQLQAYYDAHQSRYATPAQVTFSHIFFSPDRGGDEAARQRAVAALTGLNDATQRAPDRGDSFPDLYDYSDFGPTQAMRLFGPTPLAQMLFLAPVGQWAGPYRSGYGWHLVYVQSRRPPATPPLSAVRDQVRADEMADDQAAANRRAFAATRARFTVVREDQASPR
jgi:hypothetical protein